MASPSQPYRVDWRNRPTDFNALNQGLSGVFDHADQMFQELYGRIAHLASAASSSGATGTRGLQGPPGFDGQDGEDGFFGYGRPSYGSLQIPTNGGTGLTSYAIGDLLYASTASSLSRLADVAVGSLLASGGVGTAPTWSASPTLTSGLYVTGGHIIAGSSGDINVGSTNAVVVNNGPLDLINPAAPTNKKNWQLLVNSSGVFEIANTFLDNWTGVQTILQASSTAGVTVNGRLTVQDLISYAAAGGNTLSFYTTNGASDKKRAYIQSASGDFQLRFINDAEDTGAHIIDIPRGASLTTPGIWFAAGVQWGGSSHTGADTGISRSAAGVVAIGTGAAADISGTLLAGKAGFGQATPTAILHLKAGTTAASTAPLKFASGTSMTTAEAGAIEFTTDDFFATITTGTARKAFVLDDGTRLTSGKIPIATTNGRLINLTASSAYTPTNVTTDRSYDANATTLDELADIVGTIIADLQTKGILG